MKNNYFQPDIIELKIPVGMPVVKEAKLIKKKKREVSPLHERLHRQSLEGKKISMMSIKKRAFVPKHSTHTNNSLNVEQLTYPNLDKSLGSPSEIPTQANS